MDQLFDMPVVINAITLTIILSAVPLLSTAVAGLSVSILQAVTQVQEQTVSYVVRLAVVILIAYIGGGWMLAELQHLLLESMSAAAQVSVPGAR